MNTRELIELKRKNFYNFLVTEVARNVSGASGAYRLSTTSAEHSKAICDYADMFKRMSTNDLVIKFQSMITYSNDIDLVILHILNGLGIPPEAIAPAHIDKFRRYLHMFCDLCSNCDCN